MKEKCCRHGCFFCTVLFRQGLKRQPGDAGCSDARRAAATGGSPLHDAGGTENCKAAKAESPAACQKIMLKNCNIFTGFESDWVNMNDAELVQQVLAGNENAFRYLVASHQRLVLHIVGRVLKQQEDVEDVCQEVFLKVFRKIRKFRGESSLSTWIAGLNFLGLFVLFADRVLLRYFFYRFSGRNFN